MTFRMVKPFELHVFDINHALAYPKGVTTDKRVKATDALRNHFIGLTSVELIHIIGTLKYEPFSWYNSPETSDATPQCCINAMYRHFTEICNDVFSCDSESGLYHILHMACRTSMLVCGLDKLIDRNTSAIKLTAHTFEDDNDIRFGTLLAPQVFRALSRFDDEQFNQYAGAETSTRIIHIVDLIRQNMGLMLNIIRLNDNGEGSSFEQHVRLRQLYEIAVSTFGAISALCDYLWHAIGCGTVNPAYKNRIDFQDWLLKVSDERCVKYFSNYIAPAIYSGNTSVT